MAKLTPLPKLLKKAQDKFNAHIRQCIRCNMYLSGNLIKYRQGLVKRYGEEFVLRLEEEAEQRTKKWSRDELEVVIETYK